MARTLLNSVVVSRLGVAVPASVAGDVANGNYTPNDGNVVLIVNNTDASSHNFTVATSVNTDGLAGPSRQVAVAAAATVAFGIYPTQYYGAQVNWSVDNALVKVQALDIPRS